MVKVKISDRGVIRVIERRRCPGVGTYVKYEGRRCLVLSTDTPVKHRIPMDIFAAA